eukprot:m.88748 g.88748  ORF g.88748 m.88748 type:complete len:559 (-) comp14953_c0_seq3:101-1777(-)
MALQGLGAGVVVVLALVVAGQTQTSTPSSFDFGSCTCNLLPDNCDANCCCDPDCTAADKEAFTVCLVPPTASRRMCVYDDWVVTDNTQLRTERTNNNLFCVFTDNNEDRNFYTVPTEPSSAAEIDSILAHTNSYGFASTSSGSSSTAEARAFYQLGDVIQTQLSSNGINGSLVLPQPGLSGNCNDFSTAEFLVDKSGSCVRTVATTLAAICETDPSFRASTYGNLTVAAAPDRSTFLDLAVTDTTGNCPAGSTISCIAEPVFEVGSGACLNIVSEVVYTVTYDDAKVSAVELTIQLQNITTSDPILQTFTIKFVGPATASAASASSPGLDTFPRSGNPGYIIGKPVLAGVLINQTIELDSNPSRWLSLVRSSADGSCDSNTRESVAFGNNVATSCALPVTLSTFDDCAALRATTVRQLGVPAATHVGQYGSSSQQVLSDWVTILDRDTIQPSGSTLATPGACTNILTGVHLTLLTARIGSLENPQNTIIGARYTFSYQTIRFLCSGPFCLPGSEALTQAVQLSQTATFVDASAAPEAEVRPSPELARKLPEDFFHPFS